MNKIWAMGLCCLLVLPSLALAQEVKLGELRITVEGWTSPEALRRKLDYHPGRKFPDQEKLAVYISDLRQRLANIRSIAGFELSQEMEPEAPSIIHLNLKVRDSWNVVALPYLKYDTNTGLTASIRGRDYNFLGSLEPLRVNLDFRRDQNERVSYLVDTEFQLPFFAGNLAMDWYFYQAADIRLDMPWGWTGDTRLTAGLELFPGIKSSVTAGEMVRINEIRDGVIPYPVKLIHSLSLSTGFLLEEEWMGWREPTYTPRLFTDAENSPDQPGLRPFLEAHMGFDHGIKAGRIDWKGNLRSGQSISLSQKFSYRIFDQIWDQESGLEVQYHGPFSVDWWNLGVSLRSGAWYTAAGPKTGAGSYLRGIVDRRISSWNGVYVNVEAPFTVMLWKPVEWFGWDWARFSGFEMMASPVLDLAMADVRGAALDKDDLWAGGGVEMLIFSDFIRSFFVRASLAYDLTAILSNKSLSAPSPLDGDDVREISIGLGFFY